jgi:hypothetical protein
MNISYPARLAAIASVLSVHCVVADFVANTVSEEVWIANFHAYSTSLVKATWAD